MPEPLRNLHGMHARAQPQRRSRMPKVMQPNTFRSSRAPDMVSEKVFVTPPALCSGTVLLIKCLARDGTQAGMVDAHALVESGPTDREQLIVASERIGDSRLFMIESG